MKKLRITVELFSVKDDFLTLDARRTAEIASCGADPQLLALKPAIIKNAAYMAYQNLVEFEKPKP